MTSLTDSTTPETAGSQRRQRVWLVCLGVWTVLVIVALWWLLSTEGSSQSGPEWVVQGGGSSQLTFWERARDWFRLMHLNFQRTYPWLLLGPYVVWLSSRFHLERGRLSLNLPVQLAGCALFAVASYGINSRVAMSTARVVIVTSHLETGSLTGPAQEKKTVHVEIAGTGPGALLKGQELISAYHETATTAVGHLGTDTAGFLPTNLLPRLEEAMKPGGVRAGLSLRPLATLLDLLAYGALAGMAHAVHFYGRYRERERRALFLESNLSKARLHALQAQLQPHFLFNTLNAIATLLRRDPRAAETTLMSLSELLRLALSRSGEQEIPLREELRFLERYMEIQQTRFGERLRFEQEAEPETLDCLVPTLSLQPLVENAIRHGIEPAGTPGLVRVTALHCEEHLVLRVQDDGAGFDPTKPEKTKGGIGLSNLRARLEALYGANQKLDVRSPPQGGVEVRLEIPWHTAAAEPAEASRAL